MIKRQATTNWAQENLTNNAISFPDKVKALYKIRMELVKVQRDELEKIRLNMRNHAIETYNYIEGLYDHYVVKKLPKTYLCSHH